MARTTFGGTVPIIYPIDGSDVSSAPTNLIPYSSVQNPRMNDCNFGTKLDAAPTAGKWHVHTANGAETILGFYCGLADTGTASASVTFDLLKNGTTILSAPVTVAYTDPDRTRKSGVLTSTTLADNDMLAVQVSVSSSTGMAGPWAQAPTIGLAAPV